MATNDTPGATQPPAGGTGRSALDMPILRVESQYRNETRTLQRRERDQYSSLLWNIARLDLGPRVMIGELVGPNQDAVLDFSDEAALQSSVSYYQGKADPSELLRVLKFFSTYLMQQARKERDAERQQFLLFKAADLARMIVQHSAMSVNADAEALVFGIFVALSKAYGEPFAHYARHEQVIYQTMRRLQLMPQELGVRLRLGEALMAQTSYYDALVQFHTMLRAMVRRGETVDRNRGWIIARIGDLFQQLSRITTARLKDGRKLRTFIERFNRDYAAERRELPRLTEINISQVTRLRQALLGEATGWYRQAAGFPALDRRQRLRMAAQAGENLIAMNRHREALALLQQHYGLWIRVRETPRTLQERADYLTLAATAAIQLKRREAMAWASKEAAEVNGKLATVETQKRERDQARAALLA